MSAKDVIREERDRLAEARDKLAERIQKYDVKIEALDAAARVLGGKPPTAEANGSGHRRRTFKGRRTRGERRAEVLEILRQHPETEFGPAKLRSEFGVPHASALFAIEDLLDAGKATLVTTRPPRVAGGKPSPVVKYRPTKVRPGEEVKG